MSKIEQQVMAGVGVIYTARTLVGLTALKVYVLVLSVLAIGKLVWVSRVFDNFFSVERAGLGSTTNYLVYAILHTHLAVQLVLVVAAVAFAGLIVDAARSLQSQRGLA